MIKQIFIIPGMPFADFQFPPIGQPGSELSNCKYCGKKMWLSEKKRALIMEMPDAYIGCWHCLLELAKTGVFKASELMRMDI